MKKLVVMAMASAMIPACEPAPVSVAEVDACEFEYAVAVPYRGCVRIVGDFQIATFSDADNACHLPSTRYSCYGASDETYVIGTHSETETEAFVVTGCNPCDGSQSNVALVLDAEEM